MAKARHRRPNRAKKFARRAAVVGIGTGAAAVGSLVFPADAFAQPASAWGPLIECESGYQNVPNSSGASTASGFFQITNPTWAGAGGVDKYGVTRAMDASFDAQADIAFQIAAQRGSLADWNASRACWGDEISDEVPDGPAVNPFAAPPAPAPAPAPEPVVEEAPVVEEPVVEAPAAPVVTGEMVASKAREYLGADYVWSGESFEEGGFDCSGLVHRVYADFGIDVPRTSGALASAGTAVNSMAEAQPGDILYYPGHVAIYIGNGKVIEAYQTGKPVSERDAREPAGIRRILTGAQAAPAAPAVQTPEVAPVAEEAPVIEQAPVEPAPVATEPVQIEHTVVSGDTVSLIALKYEDGCEAEDLTDGDIKTCWDGLYQRNREVIGDNPNLIYPGQVLMVGGLRLAQAPVTVPEEPVAETPVEEPVIEAPIGEAPEVVVESPAEVIAEAAEETPVVEEAPVASNQLVPGARFTSGFGERWGSMHNGIDLAAPVGTPIYTPVGGVVTTADFEWHGGFGAVVYLNADSGETLWFGHMSEILVSPGQRVEAGDMIAKVGNRGTSTGPHLHFEVHIGPGPINPVGWLNDRGYTVP